MANYVFNIAKGRVVSYYERVKGNDPSTSALILIPLSVTVTEAVGQDVDTVTAFLATAADEQTGGGWVRKTLTDTELAAFPAPNDTNNRYDLALPEVRWTAPSAGFNTVGCVVAYDANTGAGTDTDLLPLVHLDLVGTGNSTDWVLSTSTFFQAA